MPVFHSSYRVTTPHQRVAEFHRGADALRRLTPPPVIVQIHRVEPLAEGSLAEFTMWFGPLPLRWLARHERVEVERGFVDRQVSGPLAEWVHSHGYEPEAGGTRLTDTIEYSYRSGPLGWLTRVLFNPLMLRMMFFFRRRVFQGLK